MAGGKLAGGVRDAPAQRDFKDAEEVQGDEGDQHGQADDENGAAELHAPAGMMTGGPDADDEGGEHEEGNEHAEGINQAEQADAARVAFGFVDEAENFQGNDG